MFPYMKTTEEAQKEMLQKIGVSHIEDLFQGIPKQIKLNRPLDLPEALSEMELSAHVKGLGEKNKPVSDKVNFLGAGVYDHYTPAMVNHILLKPEFYTAYTPYQPEVSQGTLQSIFEFQTMICEITGMDVANASVYDGATATAEAMIMACEHTKKKKILYSQGLHPETVAVLKTYGQYQNIEMVEVPLLDGQTDAKALEEAMDEQTAAFFLQSPNYYGLIEDGFTLGEMVHSFKKAIFVMNVNPMSLGILKSPGALGADVAVGDAQVFGIPLSFGGPHIGFMAAKSALLRKLPGRIVGETVDKNGTRAFVLTLQAREQHIRREKAGSNICSNQALLALAVSVYLSMLGKEGYTHLATSLVRNAHHFAERLTKIPGVQIHFKGDYFNEFVIDLPKDPEKIYAKLYDKGYLAGLKMKKYGDDFAHSLMLAVTEKCTLEDLEGFALALEEVLS